MSNEFFISYSRKDKSFVQRLFTKFKERDINPWVDFEDIQPATFWRQEIAVGIQSCRNFLFCLSPDSVYSAECRRELEHALSLEKRIIPLLVRETPPELLHEGLREINWLSFLADFDSAFEQLLTVLESPEGYTFGGRLDSKIEINSSGRIKNFFLYRSRYLIGRWPHVDGANDFDAGLIKISDPYVSRISATLQLIDNRWYLGDGLVEFNRDKRPIEFKPSRNGNQINGRKQNPKILHPLRHDDIVRLGPNTTFAYLELRHDDDDTSLGDNKETWV